MWKDVKNLNYATSESRNRLCNKQGYILELQNVVQGRGRVLRMTFSNLNRVLQREFANLWKLLIKPTI